MRKKEREREEDEYTNIALKHHIAFATTMFSTVAFCLDSY